jgi:enoyl-CoA hydratase/carnithine racemase
MEELMSDLILIERIGPVAVLTLNLPQKRNVLSSEMVRELSRALADLENDSETRALVLTGGRNFCAGGDLSGMSAAIVEMRRMMHDGHRITRTLVNGPLPSVAAVEGSAYGAGFSIALACDFVVADKDTTFCAAFGKVGLIPDSGLAWTLPQRVGIGLAREIMMLSEPIKGEQAHVWGLVDRLCACGKVLETAIALAERLATTAPNSTAATKAMLSRLPIGLDALLAWEVDAQPLLLASDDYREGRNAFAAKRSPRFTGR